MAELLSRDEHNILRQEVEADRSRIIITRGFARQFYTRVSQRNVRDLTGRSQLLHRSVVISLLITSLTLILISLILLGKNFGYTAVAAIPLTGIFWTILSGFTTEHGDLRLTSILSVVAVAACLQLPEVYSLPASLFVASLYAYHTTHVLAQTFLRRLLIDSYDAFDMLADHVEIERDAA